jgi:hypothetical protein
MLCRSSDTARRVDVLKASSTVSVFIVEQYTVGEEAVPSSISASFVGKEGPLDCLVG